MPAAKVKEETTEEILEETMDLMDEALDIMDDTLDVIEGTIWTKKNRIYFLVGATVVVAAASAATWYFTKRYYDKKYAEIADQEIEQVKTHYKKYAKEGEFATPESAVAELVPDPEGVERASNALLRYQGEGPEEGSTEEAPRTTTNIFTAQAVETPDFNLEEEMKGRSPEVPYIISYQEYLEAEPEFEQQTLTYYQGDDTLTDEKDQPIPLVEETIGGDTLEHFGYGSGNSRTVYVRNEKLSLDFEIVMSDGKYTHEVLGLQHSGDIRDERRQLRKFRGDDE